MDKVLNSLKFKNHIALCSNTIRIVAPILTGWLPVQSIISNKKYNLLTQIASFENTSRVLSTKRAVFESVIAVQKKGGLSILREEMAEAELKDLMNRCNLPNNFALYKTSYF